MSDENQAPKMRSSPHAKRTEMLYVEMQRVEQFMAEGPPGLDELRLWRVVACITHGILADAAKEVQLATVNALIPLAVAADNELGSRPISITAVDLEEALGGKRSNEPIALAALALNRHFRPQVARVRAMGFLRMYHRLHAAKLITPEALKAYDSLAATPEIANNLRSGKQVHSAIPGSR